MQGIYVEIIPELMKAISPKNEWISYKKIQALLTQYQPDIIHTHLAKAGVLGRLAARKSTSHIIHTVHGPTFPKSIKPIKRIIFWLMEFFASRYTNTFVFVGKEIQQTYIDARISKASNSITINTARDDTQINYQTLDDKSRHSLQREITSKPSTADKKIISYTARLVPGKQQDHAIQALSMLHKKGFKNTHLILIGKALLESEVQFEKQLKKTAKELNLKEHVHFLGHRDDVLEIMDASNVVILPSKYEGLPNVAVEAILSGTPIVSYEVSGIKEVLGKLTNKLVTKQGDINGMTEIILTIFFSPKNITDEYVLLKDKIKKDFSTKTMLEKKMQLYEEILNK